MVGTTSMGLFTAYVVHYHYCSAHGNLPYTNIQVTLGFMVVVLWTRQISKVEEIQPARMASANETKRDGFLIGWHPAHVTWDKRP